MGADVTLCGPATMIPPYIEKMGVKVETNFEKALSQKDVVMMLRIQLERQEKILFPSLKEYFLTYGLTEKRLKLADKNCIVMHPGPINRGVEMASEVADSKESVILDQVENGVSIRMAVLFLLLQGGENEDSN